MSAFNIGEMLDAYDTRARMRRHPLPGPELEGLDVAPNA